MKTYKFDHWPASLHAAKQIIAEKRRDIMNPHVEIILIIDSDQTGTSGVMHTAHTIGRVREKVAIPSKRGNRYRTRSRSRIESNYKAIITAPADYENHLAAIAYVGIHELRHAQQQEMYGKELISTSACIPSIYKHGDYGERYRSDPIEQDANNEAHYFMRTHAADLYYNGISDAHWWPTDDHGEYFDNLVEHRKNYINEYIPNVFPLSRSSPFEHLPELNEEELRQARQDAKAWTDAIIIRQAAERERAKANPRRKPKQQVRRWIRKMWYW